VAREDYCLTFGRDRLGTVSLARICCSPIMFGTHYPCSQAVDTDRVHGWSKDARVGLHPCSRSVFRAVFTGSVDRRPWTRPANTGAQNDTRVRHPYTGSVYPPYRTPCRFQCGVPSAV